MGLTPNSLPDGLDNQIRERLFSDVSIENKRLREQVGSQSSKVFQLEADLDFLRNTIETNLPFFNKLEQENKKLQHQISQRNNASRTIDRLQVKVRNLEKKVNSQTTDHEKVLRKATNEAKSLKERLETVTNMNNNLQRKLTAAKRKADQYDVLLERCIQMEHTNQELINIMAVNHVEMPSNLNINPLHHHVDQSDQSVKTTTET